MYRTDKVVNITLLSQLEKAGSEISLFVVIRVRDSLWSIVVFRT